MQALRALAIEGFGNAGALRGAAREGLGPPAISDLSPSALESARSMWRAYMDQWSMVPYERYGYGYTYVTHARVRACTCARATHTCTCTFVCTHACSHICTCTHAFAYTFMCMHATNAPVSRAHAQCSCICAQVHVSVSGVHMRLSLHVCTRVGVAQVSLPIYAHLHASTRVCGCSRVCEVCRT